MFEKGKKEWYKRYNILVFKFIQLMNYNEL